MSSSLLAPEERVLSTLNADGSRRWLDPKPVEGAYRRLRKGLGWFLIVLFMVLPHLHAGGRQLFFLDIAGGEFTLFGQTFLRTDTLLLALAMISLFVSIFLVTALFGRVWCGWACPQTVYLEFLFRPIARLFDGKGHKGVRGVFSKLPKGVRQTLRWGVVAVICFHLSNTFLAYFVGSRTVFEWSLQPPWVHPAGFLFVCFVTGMMIFNFGFFREQLCFIACPYGRFQSVLLDNHSLIVGYDTHRGEPRGKAGRKAKKSTSKPATPDLRLAVLTGDAGGSGGGGPAARGGGGGCPTAGAGVDTPVLESASVRGDCIDCNLCVAVCPTGIDIRDGLQLECIHCARCIDACDGVMEKVGKPKGLIRYSSQAVLSGQKSRFLRPRVVVYPLILSVVFTALITLSATHAAADIRLIRAKGQPYYTLPTGEISNQIRVRITNRTTEPRSYALESGAEGVRIEAEIEPARDVAPGQTVSVGSLVIVRPEVLAGMAGVARVPIIITDDKGFSSEQIVKVLGPMNIEPDSGPGESPAAEMPAPIEASPPAETIP